MSDSMKKAWEILKADTRLDIRNEAQYNAAPLDIRGRWHRRQASAYNRRLSAIRTNYTVELTDVENPIYQEMKEYQLLRNFHDRQNKRIKSCLLAGKTECNDYYSIELEGDKKRKQKLQTTPTGKRDPYVELSLEAYNNLTDRQKFNYHSSLVKYGKNATFHARMQNRIRKKSSVPTFPSPEYGGKSLHDLEEIPREEYLNMSNEEKRRYHHRMGTRARRASNPEMEKFHGRMRSRLQKNTDLPTYFSPEDEQEEE